MKFNTTALIIFIFLIINHLSLEAQYTDRAQEVGIEHLYTGLAPGAGVSFVDVNQDGWDDLTLASVDGIKYYQNSNGVFQEVELDIFFIGEVKQVLWADYDNDGDLDLFLTGFDAGNRLYQNIGDLEFVDSTQPAGLPIEAKRHFGACFGDINRDGYLDLYYSERKLPGTDAINQNRMFLNLQDGTFKEVTKSARVSDQNRLPFCASFIDVNQDMWPDIYIANDRNNGNTLLINAGNGAFADRSALSQSGVAISAMSVTPGDYNGDGWQDIYSTNIADGNVLLENLGVNELNDPFSVQFGEVSEQTGTAFYSIGWGAQFLDGDNDGDLDLYVSGSVPGTEQLSAAYFEQTSNGVFSIPDVGFDGDTSKSFSNAIGDFNGDGVADVAVQNHAPFEFQLWSNASTGHSFKLTLSGVESNRNGIGSFIEVYANNAYQSKYTTCGSGFLGQNTQHMIFGMGTAEAADSVIVHWPSGHIDRLYDIQAESKIILIEGTSTGGEIDVDPEIEASFSKQFVKAWEVSDIDHVSMHSSFMGGGAAFFDVDADGDDDLYITSGRATDQLYINEGDGTFALAPDSNGLTITNSFYTLGVTTGDIDNDGYRDIFVTTWGNDTADLAKNLLFYNNGDGTFTEIWHEIAEEAVFSIGANFLDYNLDGFLDIYVINYVEEVRFIYNDQNQIIGYDHDCFENFLYRNNGDLTFTRLEDGLGTANSGCALASAATDYDGDGDQDIYLANDFGAFIQPNEMYRNDYPTASFTTVGAENNSDVPIYGMGIAIGDLDYDLDFEYYITNFGRNVLIENRDGSYVDITNAAGVEDTWSNIEDSTMHVGWGTAFFDADNDMDLDLYVSNGYVPSPQFLDTDLYTYDKFFYNDGNGNFEDTFTDVGIDNRFTSRGMAKSDFDQDGDVDILSVVLNVPVGVGGWNSHLFENRLETGNWLEVKLEGTTINRDAFGSQVIIYTDGIPQIRELTGGSSHCSQNSSTIHFGLGNMSVVDSLVVRWTGGKQLQKLYQVEANQILDIKQAVTTSIDKDLTKTEGVDLRIFPNPNSGFFTISVSEKLNWEEVMIEVSDIHGKPIEFRAVPENQAFQIEVINKNSGLYLVTLKTPHGTISSRAVIN